MFCVVGTNTPWPRNPKTTWVQPSAHARARRRENQTPQQRVGEAAAYHERAQENLACAVLTALGILQQLSPTRTPPCSAQSAIDGAHRPERVQATPPRNVVCVPRAVRFAGEAKTRARNY